MARTYKTLSLSLPPGTVEELAAIGKTTGRVAARVAVEIVRRELSRLSVPRSETRRPSWCCAAAVSATQGSFILPESPQGTRRWMPALLLLCTSCGKQQHGREYEGWIDEGVRR